MFKEDELCEVSLDLSVILCWFVFFLDNFSFLNFLPISHIAYNICYCPFTSSFSEVCHLFFFILTLAFCASHGSVACLLLGSFPRSFVCMCI
ncbi:hypothetical protein VIGAN_05026300 [Vigna angularis var. angularis]|uniref:Uncharacterized protein n=1 Tax=Vigna angularis var. angularis TaxID=157739 RepID=A0A0S3S284_PHAAN|nr:hypothetical protein VIGAN_05026300 [Vigna angularis var. angularis]